MFMFFFVLGICDSSLLSAFFAILKQLCQSIFWTVFMVACHL